MRDDFRIALRSLPASWSFTIPALLMLTLGVGATRASFSVVDAVVLRGLPFDEHDRLVAVLERVPSRRGAASSEPPVVSTAAPQNYRDWVRSAARLRIDGGDRQRLVHAARGGRRAPNRWCRSA
jgi:hypothetical protein